MSDQDIFGLMCYRMKRLVLTPKKQGNQKTSRKSTPLFMKPPLTQNLN